MSFERSFIIKGFGIVGAKSDENFFNLRDNIAGFIDDNGVADADVETSDFVGIVERSVANGGTGNFDGVKNSYGGGGSGATNRNNDVANFGSRFFGRKFKSDRSARSFADDTERIVDFAVVNFYHHAVGIKRKGLSVFIEVSDILK